MENVQLNTIAIVDDHSMFRQAISFRLTLLGYKVVLDAENGKDFLDQLPKLPAPPDVCLLDINMPVMDGFETATQLKKNWPQIKIVFFSMHNSRSYVSKAKQIGADGFLSKDATADELKKMLGVVLEGE
jgi:DNA-binding NarL/FixJ family response regulator